MAIVIENITAFYEALCRSSIPAVANDYLRFLSNLHKEQDKHTLDRLKIRIKMIKGEFKPGLHDAVLEIFSKEDPINCLIKEHETVLEKDELPTIIGNLTKNAPTKNILEQVPLVIVGGYSEAILKYEVLEKQGLAKYNHKDWEGAIIFYKAAIREFLAAVLAQELQISTNLGILGNLYFGIALSFYKNKKYILALKYNKIALVFALLNPDKDQKDNKLIELYYLKFLIFNYLLNKAIAEKLTTLSKVISNKLKELLRPTIDFMENYSGDRNPRFYMHLTNYYLRFFELIKNDPTVPVATKILTAENLLVAYSKYDPLIEDLLPRIVRVQEYILETLKKNAKKELIGKQLFENISYLEKVIVREKDHEYLITAYEMLADFYFNINNLVKTKDALIKSFSVSFYLEEGGHFKPGTTKKKIQEKMQLLANSGVDFFTTKQYGLAKECFSCIVELFNVIRDPGIEDQCGLLDFLNLQCLQLFNHKLPQECISLAEKIKKSILKNRSISELSASDLTSTEQSLLDLSIRFQFKSYYYLWWDENGNNISRNSSPKLLRKAINIALKIKNKIANDFFDLSLMCKDLARIFVFTKKTASAGIANYEYAISYLKFRVKTDATSQDDSYERIANLYLCICDLCVRENKFLQCEVASQKLVDAINLISNHEQKINLAFYCYSMLGDLYYSKEKWYMVIFFCKQAKYFAQEINNPAIADKVVQLERKIKRAEELKSAFLAKLTASSLEQPELKQAPLIVALRKRDPNTTFKIITPMSEDEIEGCKKIPSFVLKESSQLPITEALANGSSNAIVPMSEDEIELCAGVTLGQDETSPTRSPHPF